MCIFLSKCKTIDTSIIHIRPRFKLKIPHRQSEILDRIAVLLKSPNKQIKGKIIKEHITLDIVGEEVHYWSPQLNFRVEEDEEHDDHSIVSGLIGPRPAVWTLFIFIYFSIGMMGFFISAYGCSRMLLGEYSNFIWALPMAILFILTAYKAGKYGESLATDQTELLKQFVRDAIYFDGDSNQKN